MVPEVLSLDFLDFVAVNTTVNCMRLQDLKQTVNKMFFREIL